jgi:hypothetical protein
MRIPAIFGASADFVADFVFGAASSFLTAVFFEAAAFFGVFSSELDDFLVVGDIGDAVRKRTNRGKRRDAEEGKAFLCYQFTVILQSL